MNKDIEFVCRGNSRRSRLCESFARAYVDTYNIEEVAISSSGVNVGFINTDTVESLISRYDGQAEMFRRAGFISASEERDMRGGKETRLVGRRLLNRIMEHEREVRIRVLSDLGLLHYLDDSNGAYQREQRQTIIRPEADLILPVSEGVRKEVVQIYSNSDIKPQIELLTTYAGRNDNFVDTTMDYNILVEAGKRMKKVVNKAMERYLK